MAWKRSKHPKELFVYGTGDNADDFYWTGHANVNLDGFDDGDLIGVLVPLSPGKKR